MMKVSPSVFAITASLAMAFVLLNCKNAPERPRSGLGKAMSEIDASSSASSQDASAQDSEVHTNTVDNNSSSAVATDNEATMVGTSTTDTQKTGDMASETMANTTTTASTTMTVTEPLNLYSKVKSEIFDKNCSSCHKDAVK